MSDYPLTLAVSRFAELVLDLADNELEQGWSWGSYDSEGVRFAFFRTYEELRELAVKIQQERVISGIPMTEAQLILSQYQAAFLDLQAVMFGVDPELADRTPAEGEWHLRQVIAHIVGADLGFFVTIKYALDRYRQGLDQLAEIPDETWLAIAGLTDIEIDSVMDWSLERLRSFQGTHHKRILDDFSGISGVELEMPSRYWEKEPMSLRFRMHRFDSHMRQHTVQVDKTLIRLGSSPNEARRLIRLIFAALAEADGAILGIAEIGATMINELVDRIETRTDEVEVILSR